jgi:hypothetical protein
MDEVLRHGCQRTYDGILYHGPQSDSFIATPHRHAGCNVICTTKNDRVWPGFSSFQEYGRKRGYKFDFRCDPITYFDIPHELKRNPEGFTFQGELLTDFAKNELFQKILKTFEAFTLPSWHDDRPDSEQELCLGSSYIELLKRLAQPVLENIQPAGWG